MVQHLLKLLLVPAAQKINMLDLSSVCSLCRHADYGSGRPGASSGGAQELHKNYTRLRGGQERLCDFCVIF